METLTLNLLDEAVRAGGPASLCERIYLVPAGGASSIVSPAKYTTSGGNPTYIFEYRNVSVGVEGDPTPELKKAVLIDSKNSHANRLEQIITDALKDGKGLLSKMPRIRVTYSVGDAGTKSYFDTQLPHRAFDGHIRVGDHQGEPTTVVDEYREARNATLDDLLPLFTLSPDTVAFGGWDSTRSRNQLRIPSVFNGEIIGILADQSDRDPSIHRAGARVDPVEASVSFANDKKAREAILRDATDLSASAQKSFSSKGKGSTIGLGAIPPSVSDDNLDGVAINNAICTHILSFSMLRTFRFGKGPEGDEAIRALIAAIILRAMAGYNADPVLRANCYLVESAKPEMTLDMRNGESKDLEPLTPETAEALLQAAYEQAHDKAGIIWEGQTFEVDGNPAVIANSSADEGDN